MPTQNARGHTIPQATETSVSRNTIFTAFGNSIRDVVPVANSTDRATLVSDLTAVGQAPSSTKPLVVYRHDAPGLHRLEYTVDGTNWVSGSGTLTFANNTARDSWTTTNSGYLSAGDRCVSAGEEYRWRNNGWTPVDPIVSLTTTGAQSGITTATAVTGISAAITLPGTSRIRFRAQLAHYASNVDTLILVELLDGATPIASWQRMANASPSAPGTPTTGNFETIVPGIAAGSHTYTLRISRAAGTGTISTQPSGFAAQFLAVEVI